MYRWQKIRDRRDPDIKTRVYSHKHPSMDVSHNSLEALPAVHTAMGLRFMITIQTRLCDSLFAWSQEGRKGRERRQEEEDHGSHDQRRNRLYLIQQLSHRRELVGPGVRDIRIAI